MNWKSAGSPDIKFALNRFMNVISIVTLATEYFNYATFSNVFVLILLYLARIAQSVELLATGWTVEGSEFESR
jgi:hypothetical protein